MKLTGYERTLAIGNLILFNDELDAGTLPEPRCSRCGNGVPVCAEIDIPHSETCRGFQGEMPICWVCERELDAEHRERHRRDWVIRKGQCQTCIEMRAEYGSDNNGGEGQPVWVVYRDGGEFACRPTFTEAIEYATRKAKAYELA